jgi:hypothetical protein
MGAVWPYLVCWRKHMVERGRFSIDELKGIGWRIKSVRSLTGLNQEEFSAHGDIPYMTLKGWELGRALPRQDGINRVLQSLAAFGIEVTTEWLIFGEGSGPIYRVKDSSTQIAACEELDLTTKAFKSDQRKKGKNSIVVRISDASIKPKFNIGDSVGGIIMSVKEVRNRYSSEYINSVSWIIPTSDDGWGIRDIFFDKERLFIKKTSSADISESSAMSIGKIVWHYFDDEQT